MATIKDIAQYANVAPSTASYVLNNTKNVTPETRERVLRAARHFDYHPNQLARSLKTRRSHTIGIIVPDIANAFFTEIVQGIEETASREEYSLILCSSSESQEKEERCLQTLLSREVDGLIILGTGKKLTYQSIAVPTITVDRNLDTQYGSVTVDNVKGGFIATDYLLQKYSGEVLMLTSDLLTNTYQERFEGYRQALQKRSLPFREKLILHCPVSYAGGMDAVGAALGKGLSFGSVFAANDLIALGAIKALLLKGLRVPTDIAVVGYDDIPAAEFTSPSLTTIRQPQKEMGHLAAKILIEKITEKSNQPRHIVLDPALVVRESA